MTKSILSSDLEIRSLQLPEGVSRKEYATIIPRLRVRLGKKGAQYVWHYTTPGGERRMMSLGDVRKLSLGDAMNLLAKHSETLADGQDPAQSAGIPKTIAALCDDFLENQVKATRKRPHNVEQILKKDIKPAIGALSLRKLDRVNIKAPVTAAVKRGAKSHGHNVFSIERQMFNYAVEAGYLDHSPMDKASRRGWGLARMATKDRVIPTEELAELFAVLDAHKKRVPVLGMKLLALTAMRTIEARRLRWDYVDFEKGVIEIPAEELKNFATATNPKPLRLPISPAIAVVLRELRQLTGKFPWVLPSVRDPQAHMVACTIGDIFRKALAQVNATRAKKGFPALPATSPHDLRRSHRTYLGEALDAPIDVAELQLGHSLGKLVETYSVGDRLEQRRDYADKLSDAWAPALQIMLPEHRMREVG